MSDYKLELDTAMVRLRERERQLQAIADAWAAFRESGGVLHGVGWEETALLLDALGGTDNERN